MSLFAVGLAGCGQRAYDTSADVQPTQATTQNVLVVLLDDVGVDQLSFYGAQDAAPTPTLSRLADEGLRFTNAWSAPRCTPGRAALATGRQADRVGLGDNIVDTMMLPPDEITIGEVMREGGLATSWVGKWHLSAWEAPDGISAPRQQGFEHFRGTIANLGLPHEDRVGNYWEFWYVADDALVWAESYATTLAVDDALALMSQGEPWGMVLSLHAAHVPLHAPPHELLSAPIAEDADQNARYRAVLEAADSELGRLLGEMEPAMLERTSIVVTSDNGTSEEGSPEERDGRVKETLYEGGVHVPMLFLGPMVAERGTSDALVHVVDLLPTLAEILQVSPPQDLDGVSLLPILRDLETPGPDYVSTAWTPEFGPLALAVRDRRYKRIEDADGVRLYDLEEDPAEQLDLLQGELSPEASEAWSMLSALAAQGSHVSRYRSP